ncbi:MAG: copper transporter [Acidimicrobiales bacterium]|nr:copper transporter [Acidimicrobiales bacterium]
MVNLRYHIVSIVAVFLALGIGVTVGSTIVDRAIVGALEDRLDSLEGRLEDTQAENDRLRGEVDRLEAERDALADEGSLLLAGRLADVPLLVLSMQGVAQEPVDELAVSLGSAGARYQGALRFTERLALADPDDVAELAAIVGTPSTDPRRVRDVLAARLGTALLATASADVDAGAGAGAGVPSEPAPGPEATAGTSPEPAPGTTGAPTTSVPPADGTSSAGTLLRELLDAGFLDGELVAPEGADPASVPLPGTRVVLVSGAGAVLPDGDLMDPLVRVLATADPAPAVAAESSEPSEDGPVDVFVSWIRSDEALARRVSTVDDLQRFAGQAAVVIALEQLPDGVVGQYGTAGDAQRLLPAPLP